MTLLKSIKINLAEKLRDVQYRRDFFRGIAQDEIAQQIRGLRQKRELRQSDLARLTKTTQSAISRIEQADYSRWSFSTLWKIADALDARVKVVIEPAETAIAHYEQLEKEAEHQSVAAGSGSLVGEAAAREERIAMDRYRNVAITSSQKSLKSRAEQAPIPAPLSLHSQAGPGALNKQ